MPPRLQLSGIVKQYPAVRANDGVALTVQPGEIHALLGENGAGKSTLMKIVHGEVQPDAGEIRIDGRLVRVDSPATARALGVAMVHQHFALFDTLTVAENVWLGLARGQALAAVARRITEVAQGFGLEVDPARPVHTLSVGERQRVEIVRALLADPRLLILDEPTSVLTPQAVLRLFDTLRALAARGCSVLYISHKLDEIRALCSACTVLRGGRVSGSADPRTTTSAELSRLMIGSEPPALAPRARPAPGLQVPPLLQLQGLSLPRRSPFGTDLRGVSLALRAGEITGLAGVSGNGQQELLAVLSGEDRRAAPGTLHLAGQDAARLGPGRRRALGLHFVPEERLGRATVPSLSLAANTLLTRRSAVGRGGWLHWDRARALAGRLIERFGVRAGGPLAAAASLSGGNLQKFIVGREIDAAPRVLVVAQPTWGVDVGAAALIHRELLALRDAGCALLVVSEELDELFALADRLHVIAGGRVSPALSVAQATREQVGLWMSGLWDAPDADGAGPGPRHEEAAGAAA